MRRLAASPAPPDVLADPPGSLRALAPGKSAGVALLWSNWCGPGSVPTGDHGELPKTLELGLASGTTVSIPITHGPRCDAPQYPSTISVARFAPATRRLPESSRLALRARIVGERSVVLKPGLRAFLVHRGQLLKFTVALTNTANVTFHFASTSCPTYIEEIAPAPPLVYLLNCRAAPSIGPGQTVLFAMQIPVPERIHVGADSLTWELAPRTYLPPFASAALAVEA